MNNTENQKPYVFSQDVGYLLNSWAKRANYSIPDTRPYQEEIVSELASIFPKLDVISERDLQDTAKETLNLSKKNGGVCLSMDRAYMPAIDKNNEVLYLETSRQVDANLNSTGLGTRKSSDLSIEQQLKKLAMKIGKRPVTIFDDVAFGGDTMLEILDKAKVAGLNVSDVSLGIATTEALARIGQADYSCSSRFTYDQILDEICERDFFVGAPFSGRTIMTEEGVKGAPYLKPFGLPVEWASIPQEAELTFSFACLSICLDFWRKSDKLSGWEIPTSTLSKPPVGFEKNLPISSELSQIIGIAEGWPSVSNTKYWNP